MKSSKKIRFIAIATSLLLAATTQAANVAISDVSNGGPLTTTLTVASGNWYQPGVGSVTGTLNINSGGSIVFTNASFETIIQQNAAGTSTININTGGSMDFSGAIGNGSTVFLGNNVATAIGIINLQGGMLNGTNLTNIIFGRDGGTGQLNILAGAVILGDSTPLFDVTNAGLAFGTNNNSFINFSLGSTGTLAVTGANQTFYQSLWNSNDLRYGGTNTGLFSDHYQVTGNILSVIPEPSAALLGGLGLFGLLRRRR